MKTYRQPDQYYFDLYDRSTIQELKELEKKAKEPNSVSLYENLATSPFYNTGVHRAQNRDAVIATWKLVDERKDSLVRNNLVPDNVKCNTCNSQMCFESYMFLNDNSEILFVFRCAQTHVPKKVIYPNGREHVRPKRRCDVCGHVFSSSSKKTKKKLIITDTCTGCNKTTVDEFDLSFPLEDPINEADRKKYCIDFKNWKTVIQDLIAIEEFCDNHLRPFQEKEKNTEEYSLDKIEKLNLPQLEQRLTKFAENLEFTKFQFKEPQLGERMTVPFSMQDPTSRNEREAVRILTKQMKKELFLSNWRLGSSGIACRLGFFWGELKSYDSDEDLLKI